MLHVGCCTFVLLLASHDMCSISVAAEGLEEDKEVTASVFKEVQGMRQLCPRKQSWTEKVPQRHCATKILPNFWVNFLLGFV